MVEDGLLMRLRCLQSVPEMFRYGREVPGGRGERTGGLDIDCSLESFGSTLHDPVESFLPLICRFHDVLD